jgi:hypothetical protein
MSAIVSALLKKIVTIAMEMIIIGNYAINAVGLE